MKAQEINLLVETYIAYILSQGINCSVNDIRKFREVLSSEHISDESLKRKIRDRRDNLIEIGTLKPETILHTNKKTEGDSLLLHSYYTHKLKPYNKIDGKYLKQLYFVVLLLNTHPKNDIEKNIKNIQNACSALGVPNNEVSAALANAVETIRDMFLKYHSAYKNDGTDQSLEDINKLFNKKNSNNIYKTVADIKIHPDFGY